jgi:DNA-binding transcriptional MerR regulator
MDGDRFTSREVQRITDVPLETLKYWTRIGVVHPSFSPSTGGTTKGRGKRRVYDFSDLIAIRLALRLRQSGVLGRAMKTIINHMREQGFHSRFSEAPLEVLGRDVVIHSDKTRESVLCHPGQLFLSFTADVSGTIIELRARVDDFAGLSTRKKPLTTIRTPQMSVTKTLGRPERRRPMA